MEKSNEIKQIAEALVKFQSEVPAVKKDGQNPFFRSSYATLENVINTIKPILAKHGLSYSQFPTGENELCTILMHISGEWLMATARMSPKDATPQGQGSAITYLRRYAISAVLGIATEYDDDGASASGTVKSSPAKSGKVDNRTIFQLLCDGGWVDPQTAQKTDCEQAVKRMTNLELVPKNFIAIHEKLKALLP